MPFIGAEAACAREYDVLVVGSGAGAGRMAYPLPMAGARGLMLEAGRNPAPATKTAMFQTPEMAPVRNSGTPDKPFGFYDATVGGGWQVPGEPYMVKREGQKTWEEASDWQAHSTDQNFMWWRPRMLGGRTNHWG